MKKILTYSIILGVVITIALTLVSAKLEWGSNSSTCPGIPYSIVADAKAGFPLMSHVSIPAMGTCGKVTSGLTTSILMKLLLTIPSIANFIVWSLISLCFLSSILKLKIRR